MVIRRCGRLPHPAPAPTDESSRAARRARSETGTIYRKPVQAPMIATHLEDRIIEQLRPIVMPKLDPEEAST
jgi:hypothetical protein